MIPGGSNEDILMKRQFIEMWAGLRGHRMVRHPENCHTSPKAREDKGEGMVPPEEMDKRDRPAGATVTEGTIQRVESSGDETPQTFFPPTL